MSSDAFPSTPRHVRSPEDDKIRGDSRRATLAPEHGTGHAGGGSRSSNSSASTPVMKNVNIHSYVDPSANAEMKSSVDERDGGEAHPLKVEEEEQEGWVCDICKIAEFTTFEEATEHEKHCRLIKPASTKKRKGPPRSPPSKKLNMRRKKQTDQYENKPIPTPTLQPRHQLMVQYQNQQGMGHGHGTQVQSQPQWQQIPQQQQQAQLQQQPQQLYQDSKGAQVAYYTVPTGNYVYQTAPAQANYAHARGNKGSEQNGDKSQQYQVANTMANMSTITTATAKPASRPNDVSLSSVMDVFIPGSMGWSCKHCISAPLRFRAPGAVSYTQERPSLDFIEQHLSVCNGGRFYEASQQQARQIVRAQPMIQAQAQAQQMPMVQQHSMMQMPHHIIVPQQQVQQQQVQMVRRPMFQQEERYGTAATASTYAFPQSQQQVQVKVEHQNQNRQQGKQAKAKTAVTSPGLVTPDVYTIPADIHTITEPNSPLLPEDKRLITDYFFYLMRQLQICFFAEDDRKARKRENVTLGFAGLQCRHCSGKASARKFFWSNVDRLANSFAEIPSHIMKCRKCPHDIKAALATLKLSHPTQMARLTRGSQKVFLRQMWNRMHGKKVAVAVDTPPQIMSPPITPKHKEVSQAQERIALSIAEDKEWLPEEEQIVRSCIEVFEVAEDDIEKSAKGMHKALVLGQVALRCIHCTNAPEDSDVLYPRSISDIYSLVQEFKESHLIKCSCCLSLLRSKFKDHEFQFAKTKTSESNERYYQLAAKLLGLVDSPSKVVKFSVSTASRIRSNSTDGSVPLDLLASVTCDSSTSNKIPDNSTMEPMTRKDDTKAPKFPHLNDNE